MKKLIVSSFILLSVVFQAFSQKTGLVLSGGGAPGLAHIGILKALEENNIPVDYITGTSIGAIVGGLYASGYSPDEIIHFFKSDDFKKWSETEIPDEDLYFFKKCDNIPYLLSIKFLFDKNKSIDFKSGWIPTSLLQPHALNFSLFELTSLANAISQNNFDSLFVPFRCVASDVYHKKAFIFRNGPLNEAIRSSMTFPFVIKPTEIDGHLLFDGGIYNNFPADVMKNEFQPDFTIGSVVAYNPPKADKSDPYMQLQNMIIQPTDYSLHDSTGLLLNFNLKQFDTFDFSKIDELVKTGYDSTMAHMTEIKAKIQKRITSVDLAERRKKFRTKLPELKFENIYFTGKDTLHQQFVKQLFNNSNKGISIAEFKKAYYKLISDETISEIIPKITYSDSTNKYNLNLAIESHHLVKVSVGGNLSTSLNNEVYIGLKYQNWSSFPTSIRLDAQTGKLYKGIDLGFRTNLPTSKNVSLHLNAGLHRFDYFNGNPMFYDDNLLPIFIQNEMVGKMKIGLALGIHSVFETGIGIGKLTDLYSRNEAFSVPIINKDKSSYLCSKWFLKIHGNTLNHPLYPTKGYKYGGSLQHFLSNETFLMIDYSASYSLTVKNWVQVHANYESYFGQSTHFSVAAFAEINYSNRSLLENYHSTIIQLNAFQPTPLSQAQFNTDFCSNQFAAVGIKPVICLNKNLQLRSELYVFEPYQIISETSDHKAYFSYGFKTPKLFSESALIYKFRNASAALYGTNYQGKWNIGFNLGALLNHK